MDWSRKPYTTYARWHTSPLAPLVKVRWFVTDLPCIEGWSLINNRDLQYDKWSWLTVGEVPTWSDDRKYNGKWSKPAGLTGKHQCDPLFLQFGEPWPVTLPDNKYDDFWIPVCCGNFDHAPGGGVEIGGPVAHQVEYRHSPGGGFSIGGPVAHVVAYTHAPGGGFSIGGPVAHQVAVEHAPGGGFVIGGPVIHNDNYLHAPGGGFAIGGPVAHAVTVEHAPGGGVELGGPVVHAFGFTHAPGGGFEVGGPVAHTVAYTHAPGGGVVLGGVVVHAVAMVHAPGGGFAIGGHLVHAVAYTHAPGGGFSIGGPVSHTYNPGTVTPGSSCATAGVCTLGTTHGATISIGQQHWWKYSGLTNGTTYYIATVNVGGISGASITGFDGSSCAGLNPLLLSNPHAGCYSFTAGASGNAWLEFTPPFGPAVSYTFNVSTTPC